MVPITLVWLKDSILWVALMSLYANIEASAAAREAKKGNENETVSKRNDRPNRRHST